RRPDTQPEAQPHLAVIAADAPGECLERPPHLRRPLDSRAAAGADDGLVPAKRLDLVLVQFAGPRDLHPAAALALEADGLQGSSLDRQLARVVLRSPRHVITVPSL